ncbi:hypothetical protein M885DRAFT_95568 [Pelagophyceae sp. CCMP2097]|nr:hypothetical protein M885DRAFT_95568 [Pelagophyceae sp. CCMP2097]
MDVGPESDRLRVGSLSASSVELVASAEALQLVPRPLVQILAPGERTWAIFATLAFEPRINVDLPRRGGAYAFRLFDGLADAAVSPEVRVLTPPPTPAVFGLGRNVCVAWGNADGAEDAMRESEDDEVQFVLEWRRVGAAVTFDADDGDALVAPAFDARSKVYEPSDYGALRLAKRRVRSLDGSIETPLLAAFPVLHADAHYEFELVTRRRDTAASALDTTVRWSFHGLGARIGATVQRSAPSGKTDWRTGVSAPKPEQAGGGALCLRLPQAVDAHGYLDALAVEPTFAVEAKGDGTGDLDVRSGERTWRRLGRVGDDAQAFASFSTVPVGTCGCGASDRTVRVVGLPADAQCTLRARCILDLRAVGASTFFTDESASLAVETLPEPPTFKGAADGQGGKCLVSWPTRAQARPQGSASDRSALALFESGASSALLPRLDSPAAAYQLQLWDNDLGKFRPRPIYSGPSGAVDVAGLGGLQASRPAQCLLLRLLRLECAPSSLLLPPGGGSSVVVVVAPPPPRVEKVVRELDGRREERAVVTWDGFLDVSELPEDVSPLPVVWSLEAASQPACERSFSSGVAPAARPRMTVQNNARGGLRSVSAPSTAASLQSAGAVWEAADGDEALPDSAFRAIARSSGGGTLTSMPLRPGLRYLFRLRVSTQHGAAVSTCHELRTRASAPARPKPPRATAAYFVSAAGRRAAFLRLGWSTPAHHGMPVDRYLAQVRRRLAVPGSPPTQWGAWRTLYLGPQARCADEATLHAGGVSAQYRVKAGSCLGWSEFSQVATVDAPEGLDALAAAATAMPDDQSLATQDSDYYVQDHVPRVQQATTSAVAESSPSKGAVPDAVETLRWPAEAALAPSRHFQADVCSKAADLCGYAVASDALRRAFKDLVHSGAASGRFSPHGNTSPNHSPAQPLVWAV